MATSISPVLGREAELQLVRELPDAVGEQVAALVIRGEPGIGKSALISDQSNPPSPTR
jgi:predicted ATPase